MANDQRNLDNTAKSFMMAQRLKLEQLALASQFISKFRIFLMSCIMNYGKNRRNANQIWKLS